MSTPEGIPAGAVHCPSGCTVAPGEGQLIYVWNVVHEDALCDSPVYTTNGGIVEHPFDLPLEAGECCTAGYASCGPSPDSTVGPWYLTRYVSDEPPTPATISAADAEAVAWMVAAVFFAAWAFRALLLALRVDKE